MGTKVNLMSGKYATLLAPEQVTPACLPCVPARGLNYEKMIRVSHTPLNWGPDSSAESNNTGSLQKDNNRGIQTVGEQEPDEEYRDQTLTGVSDNELHFELVVRENEDLEAEPREESDDGVFLAIEEMCVHTALSEYHPTRVCQFSVICISGGCVYRDLSFSLGR